MFSSPRHVPARSATLFLAFLSLLLANPSYAVWPNATNTGVPLCTLTGNQAVSAAVTDGKGGMIAVWSDFRTGTEDVYAQRVDVNGNTRWAANGVPVFAGAGPQTSAAAVSDGAGGVIVAWVDQNSTPALIRAQRLDSLGVQKWVAAGVVVANQFGASNQNQIQPVAVSDGLGGAIIAWTYTYSPTDNDIYAQRLNAAGGQVWNTGGVGIATSTDNQYNPSIVSDGANGAWIAWRGYSGVDYDISYDRIKSNSILLFGSGGADAAFQAGDAVAPATLVEDGAGGLYIIWAEGVSDLDLFIRHTVADGSSSSTGPLFTDPNSQANPVACSDGSSGLYVFWSDLRNGTYQIFGLHWLSNGTVAPGWGIKGNQVTGVSNYQDETAVVPDGVGGVLVAWREGSFNNSLVGTRLRANGTRIAGSWQYTGNVIADGAGTHAVPTLVPDGRGGALCGYTLNLSNAYDAYAQHIDGFGVPGFAQPRIVSVKDYPNDQGGEVTLRWSPSYLDSLPNYAIGDYRIWRQAPSSAAQAALRRGASLVASGDAVAPGRRTFRTTTNGTQTYYWEFLATVPAAQQAGYSYVAPTGSDSVGAGNPRTSFMIEARYSSDPHASWDSPADSGYSVDNLPPVAPAPFSGNFVSGTGTILTWGANGEPDLAGYRLYKGAWPGFTPGPTNLITQTTLPNFTDPATNSAVYKLSAYDIHGNESAFAIWSPSGGTTAADGSLPHEVFLAPVSPNPAHTPVALRFGLPREGRAQLVIFDPQGRRVRDLVDGWEKAGEETAVWDGRDDSGAAAGSGLYFVRLESEGRTLVRRLVAMR